MNRIRLLLVMSAAVSVARAAALGQESVPPLDPLVVQEVAPPTGAAEFEWQALPPAFGRYYSSAVVPINPLCVRPVCHDGRRGANCESGPIKSWLQKSHWGYCNHFEERPFGDANLAMLGAQAHRGAADLLMLYHYDFFPPGDPREGELTPRGRQQLLKMFFRIQTMPCPIVVQIVDNQAELNRHRAQQVAASLAGFGLDHADQFVLLGPQLHGGVATEALESEANLLQGVQDRGRTLESGETPKFGAGISSGFNN